MRTEVCVGANGCKVVAEIFPRCDLASCERDFCSICALTPVGAAPICAAGLWSRAWIKGSPWSGMTEGKVVVRHENGASSVRAGQGEAGGAAAAEAAAWSAAAAGRVDGFVDRHFRLRGTMRLHGAALGGDMLRAPVNLLLAPVHALVRLLALIAAGLGARRLALWLRGRRILLRTRVGARVERAVVTELLGLPWPAVAAGADHAAVDHEAADQGTTDHEAAVLRAILSAPQLRAALRRQGDPEAVTAQGQRLARMVADYAGTRAAVAEIVTALVLLMVGAVVFRALTPGMISLAPELAGVMAHGAAVADFPLGRALGGLWYGVFPVGVSPWLMAGTVVALVMLGAVMAAFAGVLADPVQARLGLHQRRLRRLIRAMAAEVAAGQGRGFAAHEHALARAMDVWDAVTSLLRALRG